MIWKGDQRLLSVGARLDTLSDDSANDSGNAFPDHPQSRVAVCAHADEPQPGVDSAGPETPVRPAGRLVLMGMVPDQFTPVVAKLEPVRGRHDCHVVHNGLDSAQDHEDVSSRLRHGRSIPTLPSVRLPSGANRYADVTTARSVHIGASVERRNALEQSREIALEAHATQRDKLGRDYYDAHLRPIAEAAAVFGPEVAAAGWLHDVIEDTPLTAEDLRERGILEPSVEAVESVSKGKADEPYEELISRACAHPLGRLVKLVDNAWNIACNPALAAKDPDKASDLMARKYVPARARLLAACGFDADSPEVRQIQAILDSHLARLDAKG